MDNIIAALEVLSDRRTQIRNLYTNIDVDIKRCEMYKQSISTERIEMDIAKLEDALDGLDSIVSIIQNFEQGTSEEGYQDHPIYQFYKGELTKFKFIYWRFAAKSRKTLMHYSKQEQDSKEVNSAGIQYTQSDQRNNTSRFHQLTSIERSGMTYLDVIGRLYKEKLINVAESADNFEMDVHDAFIHYDCLCIRRNKLHEIIQQVYNPQYISIDEVVCYLNDHGALKITNEDSKGRKRTVHVSALTHRYGQIRFYAIYLESLR